jgi:hypothetical protein
MGPRRDPELAKLRSTVQRATFSWLVRPASRPRRAPCTWRAAGDVQLARSAGITAAKGALHAVDVGRLAAEAGVKTLVLSHFVPSDHPGAVADEQWLAAASRHFKGRVILGKDLMEI